MQSHNRRAECLRRYARLPRRQNRERNDMQYAVLYKVTMSLIVVPIFKRASSRQVSVQESKNVASGFLLQLYQPLSTAGNPDDPPNHRTNPNHPYTHPRPCSANDNRRIGRGRSDPGKRFPRSLVRPTRIVSHCLRARGGGGGNVPMSQLMLAMT